MIHRLPRRLRLYLLSLCLPFALLAVIDVALRIAGVVAPEDPLLFHLRTYDKKFSPFIDVADGFISIRPDWISRGETLRETRGPRAGQYFLYPGFRPARFRRTKEQDVIRIFALGGSTTFGLYAGPDHAFAMLLETRLRAITTNYRVEAINLGCPGWASGRVLNLLENVLEFDPDLLVIYCGHNEMLAGHTGQRPTIGFLGRVRAKIISVSTLAGWLNHTVNARLCHESHQKAGNEAAPFDAGRIPTYDPHDLSAELQRRPDRQFFDTAASRFAENLEAMAHRARAAGVPALFVLPVRNLLLPPSISAYDPDTQRTGQRAALVRRAKQMLKKGRPEEALDLLDEATDLSPDHAMARYLRGRSLLSLGRQPEAESDFRMACDLDVRTHRITTRLQATLIAVMDRVNGAWVDPRPRFHADLNVAAAKKHFVDHVHPTRSGHGIIAELLLPRMLDELGIATSSAADRHAITQPRNRDRVESSPGTVAPDRRRE